MTLLDGYNKFVTQKERELRVILNKLNDKNNNSTLKEDKIIELWSIIYKLREDSIRCEKIKDQKAEEVKQLKLRIEK